MIEQLNAELNNLLQANTERQHLLGNLDDLLTQLFVKSDQTNRFKLAMSITFALLVGVVILGFFGIAWSDASVKRSIFSNEAGIQFITLFAIVISVILFGIIGVLESKELSALLGGLSGYILGKSRGTADSTVAAVERPTTTNAASERESADQNTGGDAKFKK